MNAYTLELTETELACGVTLDAVADELPRGAFFGPVGEQLFMVSDNVGPALAGAVARCAFGGPVEFVGITCGYPAYQRA